MLAQLYVDSMDVFSVIISQKLLFLPLSFYFTQYSFYVLFTVY